MSDFASVSMPVSQRSPEARAQFVQSTYVHLAFAVAGFGVMSWLLSRWGFGIWALKLISAHWWSWLAVLLGYGLLGAMCSSMAKTRSPETAYLGLGLAVVLEAALFSPLIAMVLIKSGIGAIQSAALGTVLLVAALTLVVKVSGHNFSWMGVYLNILAMLAFGLIVSSIIFGFSLGIVFCYAMLALGAGFVVYDTSRVLNETMDDTSVSAALELFGSIALVFWYMLRIFGDNGAGSGSSDQATESALAEGQKGAETAIGESAGAASFIGSAAEAASGSAETVSSSVETASAAVEGASSVIDAVDGAGTVVKAAGGVIAGILSIFS